MRVRAQVLLGSLWSCGACFDPGSGGEASGTTGGGASTENASASFGSYGEASASTEGAGASSSSTGGASTALGQTTTGEAGSGSTGFEAGSTTDFGETGSTAASTTATGEPALPEVPPVTNGQPAELVLGQPDFTRAPGGTGANRFGTAGGLASDGSRLWVLDLENMRALQFNAQPVENGTEADLAIGQESLTAREAGPDALHLAQPVISDSSDGFYYRASFGDVFSDGTVLAVADGAHRVLLWHDVPQTSGVPWDVVVGQTTSTGATEGTSATTLRAPRGVWTDGMRLMVADSLNHRVLIWNSFPTTNGRPADLVLGQADFTSRDSPSPPTASSMNTPSDVFFDGERLYVVDSLNYRVMVWEGLPSESAAPADYFVGQASGASGNANAGAPSLNAVGLESPTALTVAHGSLFIADGGRVVIHTPLPTTSGEEADAVLGDEDFAGTRVAADQTIYARGLAVFGDKLFVSDTVEATGLARVLRYQLEHLP